MRTKMILILASIFLLATQAMAQGNPSAIPYEPPLPLPNYNCDDAPKVKAAREKLAGVKQCQDDCKKRPDSTLTNCEQSCSSGKPVISWMMIEPSCRIDGLNSLNSCFGKAVFNSERQKCIKDFEDKYWK